MRTLEEIRIENGKHKRYFLLKCDYCKTELVAEEDDYNEEYNYWKCCYCGHYIKNPELVSCNRDGNPLRLVKGS